MNKNIYLGITLFILAVVLVEPSFGGVIQNGNIQAASGEFITTLNEWSVPIIAGGLFCSGICLFTSNYRMGLSGLVGTGFLYAVRAFTAAGDGALISMSEQLLIG